MKLTSDPPVFDAYSRYYDMLYQDKDYSAEVAYLDTLLQRHGVGGRELLEFGSGTGRHGRLLGESNYQVTGIERSATMAAQALPSSGFQCLAGDIRTLQLGRTFDAVLALFHVLSYQVSNADVQSVFAAAAQHLRPGGLFLFDVWYSPAVYFMRPEVRVKRLVSDDIEITRLAEPMLYPNENRVDVNYTVFAREAVTGTIKTVAELHPMRHFSLPEIDLLSTAAGFQREAAEAFGTGAPPSETTWGVCFVLRKLGPDGPDSQ